MIKKGQEGGGFQSSPEDEAGRCGACREEAEDARCGACREEAEDARAKEAGEKRPPSGAQAKPAACGCARDKRECEKPRKCKCRPGRACKCP